MTQEPEYPRASLRVRIAYAEAHYAGGLVAGSHILRLFGNLATELTIRYDGDEGLLRAYESVEFFVPMYGGDFIEARGRILSIGRTSRRMAFEAHKVVSADGSGPRPSSARVIDPPVLVAQAVATSVVSQDRQHPV
ncbi:MAG: 3-aminobutyryl-CoA ammonia lyase [Candidatus Methylomirabilales bacterium]